MKVYQLILKINEVINLPHYYKEHTWFYSGTTNLKTPAQYVCQSLFERQKQFKNYIKENATSSNSITLHLY